MWTKTPVPSSAYRSPLRPRAKTPPPPPGIVARPRTAQYSTPPPDLACWSPGMNPPRRLLPSFTPFRFSFMCYPYFSHTYFYSLLALLLAGDIEQNPGPDALAHPRQPNTTAPDPDSYMLRRDLFVQAQTYFSPYSPRADLFASPTNHLLPVYFTRENSAFSHPWGPLSTVWANPPFSLLWKVWNKARRDGAILLLLAPLWQSPLTRFFLSSAKQILWLPNEPLFQRSHHSPLLPTPPWKAAVFLFTFPSVTSVWIHDPTQDGDVEANPGPSTISLPEFYNNFYRLFVESADRNSLARRAIAIRIRTQDWPDQWTSDVMGPCGSLPSLEEGFNLLAAFEVFSETELVFDNAIFSWRPDVSDEISHLKERIRQLELSRTPPSRSDLMTGPSVDNIARFRLLPTPPTWLLSALDVFERWSSGDPGVGSPYLNDLWPCLVDSYFDTVALSFRPNGPKGPGPTARRPAELSLASLKERGGRVETEVTDHGTVTWAFLDDKRYFLSKKGALWDTSVPPPAPCFSCGVQHWFWQCPKNGASSQ